MESKLIGITKTDLLSLVKKDKNLKSAFYNRVIDELWKEDDDFIEYCIESVSSGNDSWMIEKFLEIRSRDELFDLLKQSYIILNVKEISDEFFKDDKEEEDA